MTVEIHWHTAIEITPAVCKNVKICDQYLRYYKARYNAQNFSSMPEQKKNENCEVVYLIL